MRVAFLLAGMLAMMPTVAVGQPFSILSPNQGFFDGNLPDDPGACDYLPPAQRDCREFAHLGSPAIDPHFSEHDGCDSCPSCATDDLHPPPPGLGYPLPFRRHPQGPWGPAGLVGPLGAGVKHAPVPLGTWWEASSGRVVRQIQLSPNGDYNEVIYDRSGFRLDVVIGGFMIQARELSLLVADLPQREMRTGAVTAGGSMFLVDYTLGSSGPFVFSFINTTGQLVLTDAGGATRVWMRDPPPQFGLPRAEAGFVHGPGYGSGFHGGYGLGPGGHYGSHPRYYPWLPNGPIE